MRFMNEFDIQQALDRYRLHPVKKYAVRIIRDLADLTNAHSDGWPYWSVPCRSAVKLMALIEDTENPTKQDLKAALIPIKNMLTRHSKQFDRQRICLSITR